MAPPKKNFKSLSKTAKYYRTHPEAKKKKQETTKAINERPEQRKKRSELIKKNRDHDKKYGKSSRKGKDASHTKKGIVYKDSSKNRGSKSDAPGDKRARGKGK